MRVLLVEDDRELAGYVRNGLEEEGYVVQVSFDGSAGLRAAEITAFDIIVLDVMLPFLDGRKREAFAVPEHSNTHPAADGSRCSGRYRARSGRRCRQLPDKPFSFDVLLARIRARTRSEVDRRAPVIRYAELSMDTAKREVWRGNAPLKLTRTEFSILECLMRAAGRVVARDHLITSVWGEREISDNNLEVFMRFLREKVESLDKKRLIHTERGLGYVLRDY